VYQKGDILSDKEQESKLITQKTLSDRCDEVVVKPKNPAQNCYTDQTVHGFNS
jgi:hypothetical protein